MMGALTGQLRGGNAARLLPSGRVRVDRVQRNASSTIGGRQTLQTLQYAARPVGVKFAATGTRNAATSVLVNVKQPQRVCVLGGGFGGLCAAIRLDTLNWPRGTRPEITLVDQHDRFVFKPLMYELLGKRAPEEEVAPQFQDLLASYNVKFMQRAISGVDLAESEDGQQNGGVIKAANGEEVPFDWLVVALGGVINLDMAEGAKENALAFASLDDYNRVSSALDTLEAEAQSGARHQVTVVGAGYAGVELAACVQNRLGSIATVQLITSGDRILPGLPDSLADTCQRTLDALGVQVRTGRVTRVQEGRQSNNRHVGKVVTVNDKNDQPLQENTDLVLWTAGAHTGQQPSSRAQQPGFPFEVDDNGGIATDSTLCVPSHQNIFAIGDTAAAVQRTSNGGAADTGGPWPATAQVALQQADYAAWNVWASINKRPLLPFRYQHLGELMSLGNQGAYNTPFALPEGIAQSVRDSPLASFARSAGINLNNLESGITLEGWLGGAFRRVAYWYRQPTWVQKARVGRAWIDAVSKEGLSALTK